MNLSLEALAASRGRLDAETTRLGVLLQDSQQPDKKPTSLNIPVGLIESHAKTFYEYLNNLFLGGAVDRSAMLKPVVVAIAVHPRLGTYGRLSVLLGKIKDPKVVAVGFEREAWDMERAKIRAMKAVLEAQVEMSPLASAAFSYGKGWSRVRPVLKLLWLSWKHTTNIKKFSPSDEVTGIFNRYEDSLQIPELNS